MAQDLSRIVITGASGYIGTSLSRRLAAERKTLRLVSRTRSPNTVPSLVEDMATQLDKEGSWDEIIADAGAVIHLSSRTELRAAEADPAGDERLNVEPVRNLVRAARRIGRKDLIVVFASTVSIVGDRHPNPVDETTPNNPVSVYDRHKLACEQILAEATREGHLKACTLRLSNVYGHSTFSKNANRGILNLMMNRAIEGKPLTIFGSGKNVRDFVHLDDVVEAFARAIDVAEVQDGSHYIIASGKGRSLLEAIGLVAREASCLTGRKVDIQQIPEPADLHPIERRNFVGNPARFMRMTGWAPAIAFEDGIRRDLERLVGESTGAEAG